MAVLACGVAGMAFQPATRSDPYREGLTVWRKPGATPDRAACATCHSPDGIELAAYNFPDDDIRRRAAVHLGPDDVEKVVTLIHADRAKYHLTHLLDPDKDRPLQPGGSVLPGATPEERDEAFGKELQHVLPAMFSGPILSLSEAKAAAKQMMAIDLSKVSFGIPLNRLSEDIAHGNQHASIAQWFPEIAPTVPPGKLQGWYAAEDAYLANPTDESERSLGALHKQLMGPPLALELTIIGQAKFQALLALQHRIRTGNMRAAGSGYFASDLVGGGSGNRFWDVGFLAGESEHRSPAMNGFSGDLVLKKRANSGVERQFGDLRVGWEWLGWLSDQSLRFTDRDLKTRLGMWMTLSLWEDGPYAIHNVFAEARRQLVASFDPNSWAGATPPQHLYWDYPGIRVGERYILQAPEAGVHRALYMAFTANCMRMSLWLLKDELQRTHTIWIRKNSRINMERLTSFIENADPAHKPQAEQLKTELTALIDSANEIPSG